MTVPVPAPTSPGGDAALHIKQFAEGVEAALSANLLSVAKFDTGNNTLDANGDIFSPVMSQMSSITGAVFGLANPAENYTPPNNDNNFPPWLTRMSHTPANQLKIRGYNSNLNANAGRFARIVGLAFGPPVVAAADSPQIQPAASQTFPAGSTPVYRIRYPATAAAMSGTADAIRDMALDVERATGGVPPDLAIVRRVVTLTTDSFGYVPVQYFTGELARVRGAVATLFDPGDFTRRSRITRMQLPNDFWSPSEWARVNFVVFSNERDGSNRPLVAAGETLRWNILAWGDKA